MTKQEFLDRAHEKHGYKYTYIDLKDKILSSDNIQMIFNNKIYTQKVVKHILLGRCPEKNTPLKTTEQFLMEAKQKWGKDKYDYSLVNYIGALSKIKIIYDGIIFEQDAISHLKSAPELNMNQEYFIHKAKKKWGKSKYDYSLVEYTNCKKKVIIIHNETKKKYEQTPEKHLLCAPENIKLAVKKTTEQFIEDANIIHNNKFSYKKTKYITNIIKVIIICHQHGDFTQIPNSHLSGNGCPNCNESKGEMKINKFLTEKNFHFVRQKKFDDCRNIHCLPFDFYIPSLRTCIEFDGIQHTKSFDYFGGQEAYNNLKKRDNIKNEYCEDNYIDLIRIKYDHIDDIELILERSLSAYKINS